MVESRLWVGEAADVAGEDDPAGEDDESEDEDLCQGEGVLRRGF